MSPVALPNRDDEEGGYLKLPRKWSIAMLAGAVAYGAAMVWQSAVAYQRIGTIEAAVAKNEGRISDAQGSRERIVRLETLAEMHTEMLRRIEGKIDRR